MKTTERMPYTAIDSKERAHGLPVMMTGDDPMFENAHIGGPVSLRNLSIHCTFLCAVMHTLLGIHLSVVSYLYVESVISSVAMRILLAAYRKVLA